MYEQFITRAVASCTGLSFANTQELLQVLQVFQLELVLVICEDVTRSRWLVYKKIEIVKPKQKNSNFQESMLYP